MKRGWTLVLVVVGVVCVWQGWQLAGPAPKIDARAEEIACETLATCDEVSSMALDKGPFARTYTWEAAAGPVVVECRRPYVLFGEVECKADRRKIAPPKPDKPLRNPHELKRGQVGAE